MSPIPEFNLGRFKAVAIGSSTGGPGLVEEIINNLPPDLPMPIFVAQHMPPTFTETFAARLELNSPLTVVHAQDTMPVFDGTVYIGRGHHHLRVRKIGRTSTQIEVNDLPTKLVYKPSADELFRSCAEVYGEKTLAIVLTGIGADGTQGARAVHDAGGVVLTQTAKSCVVYGMPKSCVDAGLSDAQLTPADIRNVIMRLAPSHHKETAG